MPKIVDHDERRRDIANAVLRIIAREGIGGANLRVVAKEAGWSTGIINHYFGDKQALLAGAIREAFEAVGDRMRMIQQKQSGVKRVIALLEAGMPLDDERASMCRIFYHFSSAGMSEPEFGAELANYYGWWRLEVAAAIKYAQADGAFKACVPKELSETLIALAEGLGVQTLFDPAAMSPRRLRQRLRQNVNHFAEQPAQVEPENG